MNLLLDSTGDLDLSTGNLALVTGPDEIAQKLKVRYRFFLGEWFLDQRLGVPYIQTIFEKGTSEVLIRNKLQKVAITCPGVAGLTDWEQAVDIVTRAMSISFRALLYDGGTLDFSEEFML